jgi:tetratricopeptide (TPR) repeat protein
MKPSSLKSYLPAVLIVPILAVYLKTICPTVYLGDSGEFTAAAFCLGIPHNSGYPLYSLLGKLFSLIPLGHIAFRVNVMSAFFGVMTVYLVYGLLLNMTSSQVSAFVGALLLAFTPTLWSQTVSAEVYTLHAFFVALIIRLLWWWNEKRNFCRLSILVFVAGISFGNHMQTVMLAPAVLFLILSTDYKVLVNARNFFFLSILFTFALSVYLYLPIRTEAAAIHYGDPNTLERFLDHVTARAHREGYVMTKTTAQYLSRTGEALKGIASQFGVALVFALLGWLKMDSLRWRTFFLIVIVSDFIYTVFLNIISLEITPFGLSTCISLAILSGIGIGYLLKAAKQHASVGEMTYRSIGGAFIIVSFIPLICNYQRCDQSRNYTAYEHALNIFRTVDDKGSLLVEGDNNLFPVTYCRIVEGMRKDVSLYDRYDLFFKMPFPDNIHSEYHGDWKDLKAIAERRILEKAQHGVFLASHKPSSLSLTQGELLLPYGTIYRVFSNRDVCDENETMQIWDHYATEALYDRYYRDYMTRQISAYHYFSFAKYLFMRGDHTKGLEGIRAASRMGYNDTMLHSDLAAFLIDQGLFDEAISELEKASLYSVNRAGVLNIRGYLYFKLEDYEKAAAFYGKAVKMRPQDFGHYNNFGLALFYSGKKEEATAAFEKSLAIKHNQPRVVKFMEDHELTHRRVGDSLPRHQ